MLKTLIDVRNPILESSPGLYSVSVLLTLVFEIILASWHQGWHQVLIKLGKISAPIHGMAEDLHSIITRAKSGYLDGRVCFR